MKLILVFGGTSGLGRAIVEKKKSEGRVVVFGRTNTDLPEGVEFFNDHPLCSDPDHWVPYYKGVDEIYITIGANINGLNFYGLDNRDADDIFSNYFIPQQIIRTYLGDIKKGTKCMVVSSICGLVASPLYATYSAAKAALHYFIMALNAEMQYKGEGVITEVAPGKFLGTKFHGTKTDLNLLDELSSECIEATEKGIKLYIPNEHIYSHVISRYNEDPYKFADESINYKLNNHE